MKRKSSEGGFTLVELLVSIAVAAIVTGVLSQVVTSYIHVAQRGRYLNLANSFVEAEVEALRNTGYNGLTPGTTNITSQLPVQLPRSRSATMTIGNPAGGLKQIDITVSYNDQGQSNSYSYTTYVGELGVGQ